MRKRDSWVIFLVALVAIWNTTYKLDFQPMFLWDESRQANNTMEIVKSGNYAFTTYENHPDFWNTKPHLLVLIQSVFFQILGPGLLALRLPSALAAAATVVLWFVFLYRRKRYMAAFAVVVILLSCRGFNVYHIARTGDYDALLVLLLSAVATTFFRGICEAWTSKRSFTISVLFTLAILTKSLAALIWLPVFGLLFLTLAKEKGKWLQQLVIPFSSSLFLAGMYYVLRESATPGYWNAVWQNEITGRYLIPNEGHVTHWYYYFQVLHDTYFQGFVYLLIPAFFGLFRAKEPDKKAMWFLLLSIALFLAIISFSATRIHWYIAPAIPMLAVFSVLGTESLIRILPYKKIVAAAVMMAVLFLSVWQFRILWKENLTFDGVYPQFVLQQAEKNGRMPHAGWWLYQNYKPLENYYRTVFAAKDIPFRITDKFDFKSADTVFMYHFNHTDSMHKYHYCRQLKAPQKSLPMWVFVVDSNRMVTNDRIEIPSRDTLTK
jgi:4-amino-4-deoxy-L-arabinose transferase-like glycosyltransferase